jgi:2-polyprenyl-3-methyl-5-hydroxy-6-metoxy-1,4-benzoquinol methylase
MTEFDQFANEYKRILDQSTAIAGESSEYFTDYKAAFVERLLGGRPARILDFGCGVGTLSSALALRLPGVTIHGYDVSEDSLAQIEPTLRERGVFTSDLGALESGYSLIVISNVMHHIPVAARQETISRLAGCLAPSGEILVFEHNPINPLTRLVVSRCVFDENAVLLLPREVKRYFRAAGLEVVRNDYIVFFPKPLAALRPMEPMMGWCPAGAQYALRGAKSAAGNVS